MFETSLSKMKEWEQVVTDIDQRELVVLRDVTRMPVERGDFISQNMVVIISLSGQVSLLYDMLTFVFNPWNVAVVCPNHMVAPIDVSTDYNAILMVISPAFYEEMRRRTLSHDYIKFHTNPQYALTVEQAQSLIKIVDVIEMMIKEMLDENNGAAVINRSDLAERVNCVPSQITYVISTRFTNGQGYIVESRRGGGGQIRISRVQRMPETNYLMHTINSLGDTLSQQQAEIFLLNFIDYGVMDRSTARLIKAAISDKALSGIDADKKAAVRMDIFKNMLISLITK